MATVAYMRWYLVHHTLKNANMANTVADIGIKTMKSDKTMPFWYCFDIRNTVVSI